jgi:hypothetical protein
MYGKQCNSLGVKRRLTRRCSGRPACLQSTPALRQKSFNRATHCRRDRPVGRAGAHFMGGFKIRSRKGCRFDSGPGHHNKIKHLARPCALCVGIMSACASAPCLQHWSGWLLCLLRERANRDHLLFFGAFEFIGFFHPVNGPGLAILATAVPIGPADPGAVAHLSGN